MATVESSRAAQEVQAAMVVAQKFPRDENRAFSKIMTSCQRLKLAEAATYSYPRGGQQIKGPSIHLAKAMAKSWGNLDFGIRELENKNGESVVETFCWDLESNVRETKVFTVAHERHTKKGTKTLTDPRDVYELVANMGSRRLRACILGIIPGDIVDSAVEKCYETMRKGGGDKPLADRVREMVLWFDTKGIDKKLLEKRLRHNIEAIDESELVDLRMIANSLSNGAAKREDYFDISSPEGGHAMALNEELKAPKEEQKIEPQPEQAPKEEKPKKRALKI